MILKFFSLILLILLVRIAFSVWRLLSQITKTANRMKEELDSNSRYTARNRNSSQQVYGRRDEQQKIIPEDEGEYVDYEDV